MAFAAPETPPAAHVAAASCSSHRGPTRLACFPATLKGSFAGHGDGYRWSGTATLTRRAGRARVGYVGTATVSWRLTRTDLGNGCMVTPASGTFVTRVALSVKRLPDRTRGWSYASSGTASGVTGAEYTVCGTDQQANGEGEISGVFAIAGYARLLGRLSGVDHGAIDHWSFRRGPRTSR